MDSTLQIYLLGDIIWGFVNNKYYGIIDPIEYNPYRANSNYKDTSESFINTTNYIEIFDKANPKTKELIVIYPVFYSLILNGIFNELEYQEEKLKTVRQ